MKVPMLLVSGPPGVGKTTVSWAIFDQLIAQGHQPAFVDLDLLGACWPVPSDDPYNDRLKVANLGAVWRNFQSAGARCLIVAAVVENQDARDQYARAIPGSRPLLCRLSAGEDELTDRIARRGRERGSELSRRALQLAAELEQNDLADFCIHTDSRDADEVASLVLNHGRGWPTS